MQKNRYAVLLDFGSTRTKVAVASLSERRMLFTGSAASTVKTDARVALKECFEMAKSVLSASEFGSAEKLASSSAAGGLRIGVIGLSESLSLKAGRNAAYGSGGRIVATACGLIKESDIAGFASKNIEIILFCGGYENGSEKALLRNASVLAESGLNIPVIYAGNSFAAVRVRSILAAGGKECFLSDNIIPAVGELNTAMAEQTIRDIFLGRIINMKGLSGVREMTDGILMPTPAAVLAAGRLLSCGTSAEKGVGDLMIFDVGGATTDVHSFSEQSPFEGARLTGAAESFAKRTVEGDLGLRESSGHTAELCGISRVALASGTDEAFVREGVKKRVEDNSYLPSNSDEHALDEALASFCVSAASRRHAGSIIHSASSVCKLMQRGKNLRSVRCVIGTGGPLINNRRPESALKLSLRKEAEKDILLPDRADLFLDKSYVLYAAGLLAEREPDAALAMMKKSLCPTGDSEVSAL